MNSCRSDMMYHQTAAFICNKNKEKAQRFMFVIYFELKLTRYCEGLKGFTLVEIFGG